MNISPVVGVPFGARTLAGPGIEAVQLPTGFGCSPGRQADSCLARGHASTISTCKVSTKAQSSKSSKSSKSSNRSPEEYVLKKRVEKAQRDPPLEDREALQKGPAAGMKFGHNALQMIPQSIATQDLSVLWTKAKGLSAKSLTWKRQKVGFLVSPSHPGVPRHCRIVQQRFRGQDSTTEGNGLKQSFFRRHVLPYVFLKHTVHLPQKGCRPSL